MRKHQRVSARLSRVSVNHANTPSAHEAEGVFVWPVAGLAFLRKSHGEKTPSPFSGLSSASIVARHRLRRLDSTRSFLTLFTSQKRRCFFARSPFKSLLFNQNKTADGKSHPLFYGAGGGTCFSAEKPRRENDSVIFRIRLSSPFRSIIKNKGVTDVTPLFLVPVAGLEPARCRQQWILSPPRLPFQHTGTERGYYIMPRLENQEGNAKK